MRREPPSDLERAKLRAQKAPRHSIRYLAEEAGVERNQARALLIVLGRTNSKGSNRVRLYPFERDAVVATLTTAPPLSYKQTARRH